MGKGHTKYLSLKNALRFSPIWYPIFHGAFDLLLTDLTHPKQNLKTLPIGFIDYFAFIKEVLIIIWIHLVREHLSCS